ncbi:MAG: CotH kinase family protein, partial [Bacteroidota bacterium]
MMRSAYKSLFNTLVITFLSFGWLKGQPFIKGNPDNIVFTDSVVHRIDILIEPDSLLQMYAQISDHEYPVTVYINHQNGVDTLFDVGLSLRGNTSLYADKKSFKISFNTFVPGNKYKNLEKLNLNGEHNDPAISRSKVYWEMLESMRVPGPRANHYEVWINGSYYGLYMNVEHIDENFLESRYDNNGGNLYKCLYPADLSYIGQDPNLYKFNSNGRRTYELQTNLVADDYSDLARLIDQLNNNNGASFKDSLESLLNVNSFLRAYAVDIAAGHWDDYAFNMNNYYLYKNNETGKFEFIPYDADNTFGIDWIGLPWKSRDIYNWQGNGNRPLVTRLLSDTEYRNRFSFFMNQLQQRMADPAIAHPRIDSLRTLIAPFAQTDTWRTLDYGFSYADFYNSFDQGLGGHVVEGIKPY